MDSLKTLLDRKQYELVLSLTKDSVDIDSISFRIAAFLGLGRVGDALGLIEKHKGEFGSGVLSIMKVHLEILLSMRRYDKAYEELKYYEDLPYISQEVEEYLREAPEMIRKQERNEHSHNKLSEDEIESILAKDEDDHSLLSALNAIRDYRMSDFYEAIIHLLKRGDINSHVRTYALLLLVADGFRGRVRFRKNDKEYDLIPFELEPPFVGPRHDAFVRHLEAQAKDPSISEVAISILNDLIIVLYPDDILKEDVNLLSAALIAVANEHLRSDLSMDDVALRLGVDHQALEKMVKRIKDTLRANPPIKA